MTPRTFQVLAEAAGRDVATIDRLLKSLSRAFAIDVATQRTALRQGGISVCRAATLDEARQKGQQVSDLGVDFRILDPDGRVVLEGAARGTAQGPTAARAAPPESTLRGYTAPPRPSAPSRDKPAPVTVGDGSVEDDDRLEFLPEPSESPAPSSPGRAPAPLSSTPDLAHLDQLEADDLVLLDGSREEAPKSAAPRAVEDLAPAQFAPPSSEEADLELEEQHPPRPSRNGLPAVGGPRPSRSGVPAVTAAADEGLVLEPSIASAVTEPEPQPEEIPQLQEPASAAVAPQMAPEPQRPASPRAAHGGGSSRLSQQGPTRLLFGGWFRARPRLRIVVGFALALGLGSIIPTCHSQSVAVKRIRPQLEDLSTAKAHGAMLSRLPNYRSPEEVEQAISDIKVRYSVYTVLIWLSLASALGFLWFRFS